jgi:hypothetical protein
MSYSTVISSTARGASRDTRTGKMPSWIARGLVGATALVLVGGLSGCAPGRVGAVQLPQQPASVAVTSASASADVDYDQLALDELDKIVNGTDDVTAGFDPVMQQRLSAEQVAAAWSAYQQQFGNYQAHGDPADVERGEFTVVDVPLTMAHGPGLFRVAFHQDGHIAGLFVLKAGTPVP